MAAIPAATADESASLKRLAAERGTSLQGFMRDLVLERISRTDPSGLADVVRLRRDNRSGLAARGIRQVSVFGSVARGAEKPGSDFDLLVEIEDCRGPIARRTARAGTGPELHKSSSGKDLADGCNDLGRLLNST